MKRFLVGILMIVGLAGLASAEDNVCINDPFCQGDKVVTYSTPSFFMIISSNGIQFGDGTTQTTAGGAGGGGVGALFTFTDNSGNKTAISSMTFPASIFNRLVTGSSITVLLNPSSVTMLGAGLEYYQSGSLVGSATSFVLGTNLSGSMNGRILTLSATGGSGGSDNFGTHTSSKVIDAAGFAITRVSSIVFNSGTSPIIAGMISSAAANTIVDATQINATNKGANKLLGMNGDNTLSFFTDQTSAGGGDNYGNHVATMPQVSAFAVTVPSGTVYGQLSVGSITVVGAGAGVVHTTHSVLHVRLTDQSDNDFEVAEASVSKNVGGTMVELSTFTPNGVNTFANKTLRWQDNTIGSTRTFATWTAVAYSSLTIINRSSSKTVGMAEYSHAASSESNCAAGKAVRWPVGMISNPIASLMIRGGGTGTQRYVVGYSTVPEIVDVQFSTPTAGVNFDIPTHAGGTAEGMRTLTNVTMTAWSAIPPGTWVEPIVCRDGNAAEDGSTTNSYGFSLALDGEFDQ